MSACAPMSPLPSPLPPALRADVAYRRAQGASWETIGAEFHHDPAALRRAAHADPLFEAEFEAAWEEVVREAEAVAIRRLGRLAESDDPKVALRAAEMLARHAAQRRRERAKRARNARPEAPRAQDAYSRTPDRAAPTETRTPRPVVMG